MTTPTPGSTPSLSPAAQPRAKHAEDFVFGELLGHGSFGDVVRARDKETNAEYAIKIIEKQHVVRQNKQKYVVTERDILSMCNHPNIVRLFYTFRSETCLHYVIELCTGGELLKRIQTHGSFSEDVTRFYTAEIINALEHLHTKQIVHRDLKPENVLLSADLHVKLTDFGTAKNLAKEAAEGKPRSNSFVGTAEYVPPEILTASSASANAAANADGNYEPISTAADLWSLGCLVYQMLTGHYPFRGRSDMLTFEKIKARDLYIPPEMPDRARDLILKLLVLDPKARLGAGANFAPLKSHPFFEGITFDGLWLKTPPPFAPYPTQFTFPVESQPPSAAVSPSPAFVSAAAVPALSPAPPMTPTFSGPASPASSTSMSPAPPMTPNQADDGAWRSFLQPGEAAIIAGTVIKRQHFSTKRRYLVLTNTPRLLYCSCRTPVKLKGVIPWTLSVAFGMSKPPSFFFVQSGKRKYNFEDPQKNASRWLAAFEEAMRIHREAAVPKDQ